MDWAEVRAMAADGVSTSEIARRLGINWRTAAKLLAASEPPSYSRAPAAVDEARRGLLTGRVRGPRRYNSCGAV